MATRLLFDEGGKAMKTTMRCKVKGCRAERWQRPSGLPSVLCEQHAQQIADAIPKALANPVFVRAMDKLAKSLTP